MQSQVKQMLHSRIVRFFAILIIVVVLLHCFVFELIQVDGSSMENTLFSGDFICIEKISYRTEHPKRNDIVVVNTKKTGRKQQYIKRIIGMPGESIKIKKLKEIKNFDVIEDGGMARNTISLGEDEYFLLGDNRNNSKDSRNVELGIVKRKQIRGKLCFRFFPLGKLGKVM